MPRAARKFEVLVLNQVAHAGLKRFAPERYVVVKEAKAPDVVLVRSQELHGMDFGPQLKAVARAGADAQPLPAAHLAIPDQSTER